MGTWTEYTDRDTDAAYERGQADAEERVERGLAIVGLFWSLRLLIEREEAGDRALQEAWERED